MKKYNWKLEQVILTQMLYSGFRVARSLVYDVAIVVCPFVLHLLAIVLSVRLRFTDFDYPFGILKPFLENTEEVI